MNIFLGDEVTLYKDLEPAATYITGNVSGIVLGDDKKISRVYIQGIDSAFFMFDGWKFVDNDEEIGDNDEI